MGPKLVDLFCGAGGLSHGFEQAGFKVLAGLDWDKDSIDTFRLNHPGAKGIVADMAALSPEALLEVLGVVPDEVDCVAGGPPCQGFSRNRAFRHQDGAFVDDPRNHLYWHFFSFVDAVRPKTVVLENVPEILIKSNGYFRDAVMSRFESLGYSATAAVLNAGDFGVPQRRRRAFFVAGRDRQTLRLPAPTHHPAPRAGSRTPTSPSRLESATANGAPSLGAGPTVWDAIGDLHGVYAESLDGESRYAREGATDYQRERRTVDGIVGQHFPWRLSDRQLERIRLLREGQGQAHLPEALRTRDGYGSAYRRLQRDAQALTITTWMFHPGSGMFTHPLEDRVITVREAARLQSFQDEFRFVGRYHSKCRQVGNAVAQLVARAFATELLDSLGA